MTDDDIDISHIESDWNAAFFVVVTTLRNEGVVNATHIAEEVVEALAGARLKPVRQPDDEVHGSWCDSGPHHPGPCR